jgi:hypothetical protein
MPLKSWSEMMKDAETNVTGFQPLEPGVYSFVIDKPATVGETQKGFPKFSISAVVESGPRKNARHTHHFNASESSYAMKEFFFKPLYAIGISPSFLATDPTNEAIANAFQGKRFSARVEKQKDSDYMQLVDFAPASGAVPASDAGVPGGLPVAQPMAQAAPVAPAPVAAPVAPAPVAQQAPVPDPAPAAPAASSAPANDGNPWATSPPPPPAFG